MAQRTEVIRAAPLITAVAIVEQPSASTQDMGIAITLKIKQNSTQTATSSMSSESSQIVDMEQPVSTAKLPPMSPARAIDNDWTTMEVSREATTKDGVMITTGNNSQEFNLYANYSNNISLPLNGTDDNIFNILDNLWIPLSFCLLIIIALGILLNGVTLFMFYRNKLSRTGSNQLVLNLTCCDLLVSCVSFPLLLLALVCDSWAFGEAGCRVYLYVFLLLGNVSNNCMTAIAVDRYYTVTQSQQNADVLRRQIMHSLSVTWVAAFASTLPLLFGWSRIRLDPENLICAPDWTSDSMIDRAYPVFYAIVGLVLPFLIKALCYYEVYIKVHDVARKVRYKKMSIFPLAVRVSNASRASQSSISNKSYNARRQSTVSNISNSSAISNVNQSLQRMQDGQDMHHERKLARVMVLIVMFSLLSWGPYGVCLICLSFTDKVTPTMLIISSLMAKACVVYNPLVYVAFNKKFRQGFLKALMCHYYHPVVMNTPPARSQPPPSNLVTPTHVPINAGPHTRALHRYSNSKRFSVPMLSTINEMESKYNGTRSSNNSDEELPDVTAQNQARRPTAKCSLPESEIRKAQELMKAKNNREMMQYIKKSRPQSPQHKSPSHLSVPGKGNPTHRNAPASKSSTIGQSTAHVSGHKISGPLGQQTHARSSVIQQRSGPQARKPSTQQGLNVARQPPGIRRKASVPQGPPLPQNLPPISTINVRGSTATNQHAQNTAMKRKQVVMNGHGQPNPNRRRQSMDSLTSVLSIISQNM